MLSTYALTMFTKLVSDVSSAVLALLCTWTTRKINAAKSARLWHKHWTFQILMDSMPSDNLKLGQSLDSRIQELHLFLLSYTSLKWPQSDHTASKLPPTKHFLLCKQQEMLEAVNGRVAGWPHRHKQAVTAAEYSHQEVAASGCSTLSAELLCYWPGLVTVAVHFVLP